MKYSHLLIPIHLGYHWVCIVVDTTEKDIYFFDSMKRREEKYLVNIKKYLTIEYKKKSNESEIEWKFINYSSNELFLGQENGKFLTVLFNALSCVLTVICID